MQTENFYNSQHSNPLKPRNNLFTCLACQVAFPSTERQRTHYRTDWHKYNLKRKIAQLPSVTAEQFAQKVLAQQTKGREEEERQGLVYECTVCRKSYFSENAFSNHLISKKHKELEFQADKQAPHSPVSQRKEATLFSDAEDDLTDTETHSIVSSHPDHPPSTERCLFCQRMHADFESNVKHMHLVHGFFLPDIEYLQDAPGLILYLAEKIEDSICLYCNGRGKEWKSPAAVRKHMLDKGHCKMAYDESEDPEELLQFYDFGLMSEQDFEAAMIDTTPTSEDEILLASGERVGHRRFMRHYKQKTRKPLESTRNPSSLLITENQEMPPFEPRNRKERRSKLAITDGQSISNPDMLAQLPEAVQKQQFRRQVSERNNFVATARLRIQNPI
ncbi:C2H2 type zinc-finger-domain-containing protein [Blakeslea trispora]|nr:C2H2 type zinc-finger-domain-containing protein [Blakeslea trispora]